MRIEEEIMVSICCATYNHEKYIADALEGFLMQETDFKFEVLIHDDASTDRTAEIIKSYEQKYPEIIKPIYQTENQYSKGVKISLTFNYPRAKGKYIAICEGDDYWTDSHKLQKQVEEMEKHPECDISFHPSMVSYVDDRTKNYYNTYLKLGNTIISPEEMMTKQATYCSTSSMMFRRTFIVNLPHWFEKVPTGDFFLQLLGSARGGAMYIDFPMSVYRKNVKGSWSEKYERNIEFYIQHMNQTIEYLNILDNELNHKYNQEIHMQISNYFLLSAFKLLLHKKYNDFDTYIRKSWYFYPRMSNEQIIMYYFKKTPSIILYIRSVKNIIVGLKI